MKLHLTPDAATHYSTLVADEDQIIVELAEDWLALHAEGERLRALINNSVVQNCLIIPRSEAECPLFNGDEAFVRLDGYAIVPREQYEALRAALEHERDCQWCASSCPDRHSECEACTLEATLGRPEGER